MDATSNGPAEAEAQIPQEAAPLWNPRRVVAAALTGTLVVFSFPLYGPEYHLDHLIWVAFVPLFAAAQGIGGRRGFFLGWVAGMTLETSGFVWILYAILAFGDMGGLAAAGIFAAWAAYSTVPWALLGLALGRCRRAADIYWVIPIWVAIEWYYPRIWPWHIGGAIYARAWLLQCVDIFGASGMTALIFAVNATVFRVWRSVRSKGDVVVAFPKRGVIVSLSLLVACLVYGGVRKAQLESVQADFPEVQVGFVHGSLDPRTRRGNGTEKHIAWTKQLLAEHPETDLVIWPESACSDDFVGPPPRLSVWDGFRTAKGPNAHVKIRDDFDVPLVVGVGRLIFDETALGQGQLVANEVYNVSAYIRADDEVEFYAKNHPVPFGESLPFVHLLPDAIQSWIHETFPLIGRLDLGVDNPPMNLDGQVFRNLVCYEAVIPEYVRDASSGSDFLVNITEDIWYGRTAHIPQHLSVLILRAVESRVPIARVSNIGPSGIVDVAGNWQTGGEILGEGRFVRTLRPGQVTSVYRSVGHWFPLACLVSWGVWVLRRRRASRPE